MLKNFPSLIIDQGNTIHLAEGCGQKIETATIFNYLSQGSMRPEMCPCLLQHSTSVKNLKPLSWAVPQHLTLLKDHRTYDKQNYSELSNEQKIHLSGRVGQLAADRARSPEIFEGTHFQEWFKHTWVELDKILEKISAWETSKTHQQYLINQRGAASEEKYCCILLRKNEPHYKGIYFNLGKKRVFKVMHIGNSYLMKAPQEILDSFTDGFQALDTETVRTGTLTVLNPDEEKLELAMSLFETNNGIYSNFQEAYQASCHL